MEASLLPHPELTPKRIAFVGGKNFDQAALDGFLWKLRKKYPDTIIVTGNGQGAEKHAQDSARMLGFTVEVPRVREDWFGKEALACQVSDVLAGADIIVVIGKGGRPTLALGWWHRMNMHERDARGSLVKRNDRYVSHRTDPIPLYHI